MEMTRRDFFRRLGSRERLANLVGKVSQGWSEIAGSLSAVTAPAASAEEAGRSLGNRLLPRQELPAGTRTAPPPHSGQREELAPPAPLSGPAVRQPPASRQSTLIQSVLHPHTPAES